MNESENRLGLLLLEAEEEKPVLEDGLPEDATQRTPKRKNLEAGDWPLDDKDWNDLPYQPWSVIAPPGRLGDKLIDAIKPLIALREEEQGAPPEIYRVEGGMSVKKATAWIHNVFWAEHIAEEERPRYAVLLGNLGEPCLELQHVLGANKILPGRIHFMKPDGEPDIERYAAYAEKVVRYARNPTTEANPDMLFFTARDGTAATTIGHQKLVRPSLEAVEAKRNHKKEEKRLPAASVREIEADCVDDLLDEGAQARPSVLFSVSHGLGAPRRGWKTDEEQWRRQGGIVLRHDDILDGERMADAPAFLPGGLWFMLACFGGGTPQESAYHEWLKMLADEGAYEGAVKDVLHSLPSKESGGFVAAVPQAALAHANGPLAIIAHMDLAWTYAFSSATDPSKSRKSRITSPLEILVRGSRVGIALHKLMDDYNSSCKELLFDYKSEQTARIEKRNYTVDPVHRAHSWMLCNDLRGYIVLGDPAARLPLRKNALAQGTSPADIPEVGRAPAEAAPAPAAAAEPRAGAEVPLEDKLAAIRALYLGEEAPRDIARRFGVDVPTLWAWHDVYDAAGRERLGQK